MAGYRRRRRVVRRGRGYGRMRMRRRGSAGRRRRMAPRIGYRM